MFCFYSCIILLKQNNKVFEIVRELINVSLTANHKPLITIIKEFTWRFPRGLTANLTERRLFCFSLSLGSVLSDVEDSVLLMHSALAATAETYLDL